MARDRDHLDNDFDAGSSGGWSGNVLADEEEFDRRTLWRLGSWGVGAVGAVTLAMFANQWSSGLRGSQVAAADLARQSQQIQWAARESQSETRRLASAVTTLNGDRDRLYSRITTLERGLDSVTGSIKRPNSAAGPLEATASPPSPEPRTALEPFKPLPAIDPPAIIAAAIEPDGSNVAAAAPSAGAAQVEPQGGGDAASTPAQETVGSIPALPATGPVPPIAEIAVQRTAFGVDLGGSPTIAGLRMLWRRVVKANKALTAFRPIIAVKENPTKPGMQLRLIAGPFGDAAAAAAICATLTETGVVCETSVFDGQRLAMDGINPPAPVRAVRKRSGPRGAQPITPAPKPLSSALSLTGAR